MVFQYTFLYYKLFLKSCNKSDSVVSKTFANADNSKSLTILLFFSILYIES